MLPAGQDQGEAADHLQEEVNVPMHPGATLVEVEMVEDLQETGA